MNIRIVYVDNQQIEVSSAAAWEIARGEGIDYIEISNPLLCHIHSASLYWLYEEHDTLVAGWGSVRYDPNPLTEILFYKDGNQEERKIEFMPDLRLSQVKLGHWWPGTSGPVIDHA